jgi:hypothetical protein
MFNSNGEINHNSYCSHDFTRYRVLFNFMRPFVIATYFACTQKPFVLSSHPQYLKRYEVSTTSHYSRFEAQTLESTQLTYRSYDRRIA